MYLLQNRGYAKVLYNNTLLSIKIMDMEVGLTKMEKHLHSKGYSSNLIFITHKECFPSSLDACQKINNKQGGKREREGLLNHSAKLFLAKHIHD